ncbi:CHAP domain-containing protein [Pseudomonas chlororaphis]|uniref:CHAP domain-containing protein n=1 Tax=Pseudomonas chlororaphis TaxID=587753 RepID=UPI0014747A5C|nr:CHAP domain-containing protein [Pseudomonas chlororaphis]NNB47660.1 CHAP domain-containing protein [Pseudomonas chlororaphis]
MQCPGLQLSVHHHQLTLLKLERILLFGMVRLTTGLEYLSRIEHGRLTWLPGNGSLSPPLAAEWGNPDKLLNSWKVETQPLPGDIGAYTANYSNASGHVGFVVAKGVCVSAGWSKVEVNDAGFRNFNGTASRGDHDFTVFRRYKHSKPQ